MKKLVIIALLICSWLALPARATIQYGSDAWDVRLDAYESITCIAHFVWSSVEFNDVPVQLGLSGYMGGDWADIGWEASLSADNKIAYMSGPTSTNNTSSNHVKWFAYTLSYSWNDADPDFDSEYPVYIDTAIYNGPPGSEPIDYWGRRGTPGVPSSWGYRDIPYAVDEPWYDEDFFNNPAPEPATICLLGFGAAFLKKRRPSKNS